MTSAFAFFSFCSTPAEPLNCKMFVYLIFYLFVEIFAYWSIYIHLDGLGVVLVSPLHKSE